jgi:hypothetical protein
MSLEGVLTPSLGTLWAQEVEKQRETTATTESESRWSDGVWGYNRRSANPAGRYFLYSDYHPSHVP